MVPIVISLTTDNFSTTDNYSTYKSCRFNNLNLYCSHHQDVNICSVFSNFGSMCSSQLGLVAFNVRSSALPSSIAAMRPAMLLLCCYIQPIQASVCCGVSATQRLESKRNTNQQKICLVFFYVNIIQKSVEERNLLGNKHVLKESFFHGLT